MGSIYYVRQNPRAWVARDTELSLKPEYGGEHLVKVLYGECDDYPAGREDLEMYMRKSIFEKVMSGEYRVDNKSRWKGALFLVDKDGRPVKPIDRYLCY